MLSALVRTLNCLAVLCLSALLKIARILVSYDFPCITMNYDGLRLNKAKFTLF